MLGEGSRGPASDQAVASLAKPDRKCNRNPRCGSLPAELWERRDGQRKIPAVGDHAGRSQQLSFLGLKGEHDVQRKRGHPAGNPKEQGQLRKTSVSSEETLGCP